MLDRAKVVDENFAHAVAQHRFPEPHSAVSLADTGLSQAEVIELFDSQMVSRHLDLKARGLKERGLGFYTIGSAGHEGNVGLAKAFRVSDMALLHYRSGAFMVQRGKQNGEDITYDICLSLTASKSDPIASGRHKVWGSVRLNVPPQTSTIASHLPKAVGLAFSIRRAKELKIKRVLNDDGVILCSFGDASVNHSTAQGAFNAAEWIAHSRYPLPLVFICEDNGLGISVATPKDWIENSFKAKQHLHYLLADGLNILDVYQAAKQAEIIARQRQQPVFLHVKCVRLLGHAGSDIESQYLSQAEIEAHESQDPLLHTARFLIHRQLMSSAEILKRYEAIRQHVDQCAEQALATPKLSSAAEVMSSIVPPKRSVGEKSIAMEADWKLPRNLCQSINYALREILSKYDNAVCFGEDVGKKGGVYRVTADLMKTFGQRRVFDTLLDEQTILGHAIGMSMNGFLPIPEIQFLAYLHNAEDQLRGEAATLSFFSSGQYDNPMVVRVAGLAYQKGFGGHFHNDNSLAVLRDIPGLVLACPSSGEDAAGMLKAAVELAQVERRIVVFIEPIALYMTKDLHQPGDGLWLSHYPSSGKTIALGECGIMGEGSDVGIVTYGNGYYLARQATKVLQDQHGIKATIVDIRWLAPLPVGAILKAVGHCDKVLIVDECRRTGSLSEALMAMFFEAGWSSRRVSRMTGCDTFIPLGNAWVYVLPSKEDIIHSILHFDKRAVIQEV